MIHYYVYYLRKGNTTPTYERTCGTPESAEARVKILLERGHIEAWYQTDVIKNAFY